MSVGNKLYMRERNNLLNVCASIYIPTFYIIQFERKKLIFNLI